MALQGTIANPFTLTGEITNAYAKIGRVYYYATEKKVELYVDIYYSQADRDGDSPARPIASRYALAVNTTTTDEEGETVPLNNFDDYFSDEILENGTLLEQAYIYLKTLPEWEGWTDV